MVFAIIQAIEDDSDRTFMTELYFRYERLLYSEIYKIIQDPTDIEDVMQSTIEKLIGKIPSLRTKTRDRLVNYLISAARNTAISHLRMMKKASAFQFDESWFQAEEKELAIGLEARVFQNMDAEALALHWPKLDERTRYLLEARYILEKTDSEMAEDLGVKPASVRMALTRARNNAYLLLKSEIEPAEV